MTTRIIRLSRALATARAMGANYSGALPLPAAMRGHPAMSAAPTETYPNPADVGGWRYVIEAPDETWIAFVDVAGKALLWTKRDVDGGVIGPPFVFRRPDLKMSGTVAAARRLSFARACEATVDGQAPEAGRLWRAGWNETDKGALNFTPESARLCLADQAERGNPLVWYYEHEDTVPLEKRGGCPMRGVCSAPSSVLTARGPADAPELWAEHIAWTDEARRQIVSGERRQLSPIAAFDEETREIVAIRNVSLCAEGATHHGTLLASREGRTGRVDELMQQLMDAINASDWEAAENIVQQMEAADAGAGGMMAKAARMMLKSAKPAPAPSADPATPVVAKKLAVLARDVPPGVNVDTFNRIVGEMQSATQMALAAAKRSDRQTVVAALSRAMEQGLPVDLVDERQHLAKCDPVATEEFVESLRRKRNIGVLVASKGEAEAVAAKPGGQGKKPAPVVETFGLSAQEMGIASQQGITFEDFAKSKARLESGRRTHSPVGEA